MKKLLKTSVLFLLLYFYSCTLDTKTDSEDLKKEIIKTEKEFAEKVKNDGIKNAFLFYAADDAVLMRNNKLIKGKDSIKMFFDKQAFPAKDFSLTWKPDFVDVSESGDLAYSYGNFIVSFPDSSGKISSHTGIFHTVWKKQVDGTWKFVWD